MLMFGGANDDTFMKFDPDYGATFAKSRQIAPMPELLDTVRATGATNVVLVGTNGWCGDLSKWLQYEPSDSLGQMSEGISYFGWCWDPWSNPDDVLIKDIHGTPTDGWGQYFHGHLACVAAGSAPCP